MSVSLRFNGGRRIEIRPSRLLPPSSALTRAAEEQALRRLTPTLLNHSYRVFAFGAAIGEVERITVDREVLLAAALLHNVGLPTPIRNTDFTVTSARIARDVAEEVGLSSAATHTLRTAITLHHSPGVTRADGPVAYLLAAGAAVDVVGFRSWQLPNDVLAAVVVQHPRLLFKGEYAELCRIEAERVPKGRMEFLRRYGLAFAIRHAPFRD
ncbi:MAG: HD domain-containing protein [Actinomycetota bacterium]